MWTEGRCGADCFGLKIPEVQLKRAKQVRRVFKGTVSAGVVLGLLLPLLPRGSSPEDFGASP